MARFSASAESEWAVRRARWVCRSHGQRSRARNATTPAPITEDAELRERYREFTEFETGHRDRLDRKMAKARRTSGATKLGEERFAVLRFPIPVSQISALSLS